MPKPVGNFIRLSNFLVLLVISLLALHACAPLGEAGNANNARTYDQSYDEMTSVVKRAIKAANLNIAYVDDSESNLLSLIINRDSYINTNTTQSDRGRIRIRRISEGQTQVEVVNPEYGVNTPSSEKVNYHRLIFNRIDDQLNIEN